MSKVLCTFGVVLMCLHTFVVVRTSPMGRQTPRSLQQNLQRNLTILSRIFNLTTNNGKGSKASAKHNVRTSNIQRNNMDPSLARSPVTFVRKVSLFSKYQYFLQMSKGGYVDGTINNTGNPNVMFELQSVRVPILRIKHVPSQRYLGMDKYGNLRGRLRPSLETLFTEKPLANGYDSYTSYKYPNWFLAIRRNGSQKPGRLTAPGQKAIYFLSDDFETG